MNSSYFMKVWVLVNIVNQNRMLIKNKIISFRLSDCLQKSTNTDTCRAKAASNIRSELSQIIFSFYSIRSKQNLMIDPPEHTGKVTGQP